MSNHGTFGIPLSGFMWWIAGSALILATYRFAMGMESLFRTWFLTLLVILIPWSLYFVRRAVLPVDTFRDRWLLAFKWLPSGLILLSGIGVVQDGLGLDLEFGMTPAVYYLVVVSPCLLLAPAFRSYPRRVNERNTEPRSGVRG